MRVLIVDDEKQICSMMQDIFEKKGWKTASVSSGNEALEILRKEDFDVVFLGLVMPGMDGIAVLKEMRGIPKLEKIPVLFVTAKELSAKEREELIKKGAQGIYTKPMDPLSAVESAIQLVRRK